MNTETLAGSDVDFELWGQEFEGCKFPKVSKIDLGAAACNGCPLLRNNLCPGKASAVAECPPEAKVIKKEEVRAALLDDNIGSLTMDGGGGFYALPNKAATLQTAIIPAPQAAKKTPVPAPRAQQMPKVPKTRERAPVKRAPGLLNTLGKLAVLLFGGNAMAPVKK